jgi:hypothetical protein
MSRRKLAELKMKNIPHPKKLTCSTCWSLKFIEFQISILLAGAPPALGSRVSPSGGIGADDEVDKMRKNPSAPEVRVIHFRMRIL